MIKRPQLPDEPDEDYEKLYPEWLEDFRILVIVLTFMGFGIILILTK